MADIAYVPTTAYDSKYDTQIKKPDLFSTLMLYAKRIVATKITTDELTIYTVPNGKTFFLLTAQVSAVYDPNSNATRNAAILISEENVSLLKVFVDTRAPGLGGGAVSTATESINFSVPLRFVATEYLKIKTTTATAHATIIGYEIDTTLVPFF